MGSDCSGLDAATVALDKLGVSDRVTLEFCCDKLPECQTFLKAVHKPKLLFTDVVNRDLEKVPKVDVYTAGFPCQPWSSEGKGQGRRDELGRGAGVRSRRGVHQDAPAESFPAGERAGHGVQESQGGVRSDAAHLAPVRLLLRHMAGPQRVPFRPPPSPAQGSTLSGCSGQRCAQTSPASRGQSRRWWTRRC